MNQGLLIILIFQVRRLKHGEVLVQGHRANKEEHCELDSTSNVCVYHNSFSALQHRDGKARMDNTEIICQCGGQTKSQGNNKYIMQFKTVLSTMKK